MSVIVDTAEKRTDESDGNLRETEAYRVLNRGFVRLNVTHGVVAVRKVGIDYVSTDTGKSCLGNVSRYNESEKSKFLI